MTCHLQIYLLPPLNYPLSLNLFSLYLTTLSVTQIIHNIVNYSEQWSIKDMDVAVVLSLGVLSLSSPRRTQIATHHTQTRYHYSVLLFGNMYTVLWLRFFLTWLRFFLTWLRFFLTWLRFLLTWLRVFLTWLMFFLTLTEVFPCFFLSCKTNARVKLSKTDRTQCCLVVICVVLCSVLVYCYRVTTQL
jgi:hypothetical protein